MALPQLPTAPGFDFTTAVGLINELNASRADFKALRTVLELPRDPTDLRWEEIHDAADQLDHLWFQEADQSALIPAAAKKPSAGGGFGNAAPKIIVLPGCDQFALPLVQQLGDSPPCPPEWIADDDWTEEGFDTAPPSGTSRNPYVVGYDQNQHSTYRVTQAEGYTTLGDGTSDPGAAYLTEPGVVPPAVAEVIAHVNELLGEHGKVVAAPIFFYRGAHDDDGSMLHWHRDNPTALGGRVIGHIGGTWTATAWASAAAAAARGGSPGRVTYTGYPRHD